MQAATMEKDERLQELEILALPDERRGLSAKSWAENRVPDLMLECPEDLRVQSERTSSLNNPTFDFAQMVLEFLITVRRRTLEEGIATYQVPERVGGQNIKSIYSIGEDVAQDVQSEGDRILTSVTDIFKKALEKSWIPHPDKDKNRKNHQER